MKRDEAEAFATTAASVTDWGAGATISDESLRAARQKADSGGEGD